MARYSLQFTRQIQQAGPESPAGGINVMRLRPHLSLLSLLLSVGLLLGVEAGALAQEEHGDHAPAAAGASTHPVAARKLRWSDPAAWPDGRVPAEGAAVTIARDMDMVLD